MVVKILGYLGFAAAMWSTFALVDYVMFPAYRWFFGYQ